MAAGTVMWTSLAKHCGANARSIDDAIADNPRKIKHLDATRA